MKVNIKFISSSVLKTSGFLRMRSTSENSDVSTHGMKHIWHLPNKSKFSFYFILFLGYMQKGRAENAKTKIFSKPKYYQFTND